VPHRGIYLFVSPDGVHWRRNETIMLQLGTGGESHWYWDDQAGTYRYLLKWDHGPGGREAVEAETNDIFTAWPLDSEGDPKKDLATPWGYMPTRFAFDEQLGQVYRTRVMKYPWAPDTYLAFLWRFDRGTLARQVELATSRDGKRWKHFGDDWYMPAGFDFQGSTIHEVTSVDGLIRRDDELWQYADYSTGRHDGNAPYWRVRLVQRLDGFTALRADDATGRFTTRPLTFQGRSLVLNAVVNPGGEIRVAIVDERGRELSGCALSDCDAITGDSLAHAVTWCGKSPLEQYAGRPVRLKFEMRQAKLFAIQFE
jgi:hypothetical protein